MKLKWTWGWPRALSLKSMRGRMALLLGLAMLPAGAIAMQVGLNAVAVREAAERESYGRLALQSIVSERSVVDETREVLRVLAATPALSQLAAGDCRAWLGSVIERYRYLASIAVTDNAGVIRCSVPAAAPGYRPPATELRRRAMVRGAFTMGYVSYGVLARQPVLGALEPLRDATGRQVGMIGASITISRLEELLRDRRGLENARAAIIDFTGRVVAEAASSDMRDMPGLPTPAQVRNHLGGSPVFLRVQNGEAVVMPLHAPDLYAVVAWRDAAPAWRRWAGIATSIAAPLLIWMLAMAAGWFAIEVFVARPLSNLETAARSFARGEDVREPPALRNAPDEIRSLRRTISAMAKTLRGREERLVQALGEERALLREVHHRVKNNLQMVASLLNIQARAASDESEAMGLARAHDRVQLLALAHQRIYASGEVRALRLDELAADIARTLLQSRGAAGRDIDLKLMLSPAQCDVDRAVPLTFLIGEGVSSALDSLANAGSAVLCVMLQQDEDGEVRIAIDAGLEAERAGQPGPGVRLIDAFARQLGAAVGRDAERPYMLWVRVPPPAAS